MIYEFQDEAGHLVEWDLPMGTAVSVGDWAVHPEKGRVRRLPRYQITVGADQVVDLGARQGGRLQISGRAVAVVTIEVLEEVAARLEGVQDHIDDPEMVRGKTAIQLGHPWLVCILIPPPSNQSIY